MIYGISILAVWQLGWMEGMVFVSDFGHPWRAQFNSDFVFHLVLLALWVIWREKNLAIGIPCGLGCFLGGIFVFPYLLVNLIRCDGDIRKLVLGHRGS